MSQAIIYRCDKCGLALTPKDQEPLGERHYITGIFAKPPIHLCFGCAKVTTVYEWIVEYGKNVRLRTRDRVELR